MTMIMMFAVTQLFGTVSQGVANARSTLEMTEALRGAVARIRIDLEGATAVTSAPERPDAARGYLEIIEGPVGPWIPVVPDPVVPATFAAIDSDTGKPDTTVGDPDDRLLFTTRSRRQPFVGRCVSAPNGVLQSDLAEVAYFVRGRTLYRRVLLIAPTAFAPGAYAPAGFYANNDVSVRLQNGVLVPNSLADLVQRENRFAHPPGSFPFDARPWGHLGLPTLQECSHPNWIAGGMTPVQTPPTASNQVQVPKSMILTGQIMDYWNNPHPWTLTDPDTGVLRAFQNTNRAAEDVLLNNVLSFDVKVWIQELPIINVGGRLLGPEDPGYKANFNTAPQVAFGAYGDLDCIGGSELPGVNPGGKLSKNGNSASGIGPNIWGMVYDTWSTSYAGSQGTNGLDDNGDGVVDDRRGHVPRPPVA